MDNKKPKHNILAVAPQVTTSLDGTALTIRAEIVEKKMAQSRRTGKYIHLSVTPRDGMLLLTMLKRAQELHGWEDAPTPSVDRIPPASERN